MPSAPTFTIFTPTYNRAHTLHRVFDSLLAQTMRDFEWLVVDDGSTDGTADRVAQWAKVADFPVSCLRQEHTGKHVAYNRALAHARGYFLATLDSDDALVSTALERLAFHWNAIPIEQRGGYSGVRGLCCNQHGDVIGDRYPASPLDSNLREQRYVHRLRGEKWGVARTEILRRYPFPEIAGTQFVPEGVVWLAVAKSFQHRAVNEVLRVYYVDDAATGATLSGRKSLADAAPGRLCYYLFVLNNDIDYFFRSPTPFLKAATMLPIVARHSGRPFRQVWRQLESGLARSLVLSMLPISVVLYHLDNARTRWHRKA